MERALRVITVERGHDPRLFTLVAFGGAGALHAAELAAALGIRRVYVPRQPGLLSAWGVLAAEVVRDHGRTLRAVAPGGVLERGFRALARAADLGPGRRLRGPAVICEYSATTLVPPGWRVFVDRLGGLLLEV